MTEIQRLMIINAKTIFFHEWYGISDVPWGGSTNLDRHENCFCFNLRTIIGALSWLTHSKKKFIQFSVWIPTYCFYVQHDVFYVFVAYVGLSSITVENVVNKYRKYISFPFRTLYYDVWPCYFVSYTFYHIYHKVCLRFYNLFELLFDFLLVNAMQYGRCNYFDHAFDNL